MLERLRSWRRSRRGGRDARPRASARTRDDVRSLALEEGLDVGSAEQLAAVAQRSLRLRPSGDQVDPLGTRLGGAAMLPIAEEWPRIDGRPLAYVGQLRLPDAGADGAALGLPAEGLLTFFYDAREQPWGFDPADLGSWRVDWRTDLDALSVAPWPDDLDRLDRFTAVPMRLELEWTVPAYDAYELDDLAFAPDLRDRVEAVGERLTAGDAEHRVLGFPGQIQNEMRLECELVSRGVYVGGDGSELDVPDEAVRAARAWRLLLQVDSDQDVGTAWGDGGRIYVWIRAADLEARDFSSVHLSLQCF